MGINDLQSQVNQLRSLLRRQQAVTDHLRSEILKSQNTDPGPFPNPLFGGGGGGGGGNPVEWGRLKGNFVTAKMAGPNPPFANYKEAIATLQQTQYIPGPHTPIIPATKAELEDMGDVKVFTLGLHNSFKYDNSSVSMVKDDVFTAWANVQEGDSYDYYRLTESAVSQHVYGRVNVLPYVNENDPPADPPNEVPSWLGEEGEFYVYRNEKYGTHSGSVSQLWDYTNSVVGNSDDEWDVRLRTGHALNAKDMYSGQFWPDDDLFIVDQIACIMALVGSSAVSDSVGCFSWGSDPIADTNFYYPMGKRFNILGQFAASVNAGQSAAFLLGKWNTDDFAQETIYGTKTPGFDTDDPGYWPIEFASGAVRNAMNFQIKGHGTFGHADADIVACQYDEASGVYLAAPLRCTED